MNGLGMFTTILNVSATTGLTRLIKEFSLPQCIYTDHRGMLPQMVVFVGWFCASAAMTSKVNIGLDQSLSMPKVGALFLSAFQ